MPGNSLEVFVSSPQALKEIFTKDTKDYELPSSTFFKFVGEKSIGLLSGDRHCRERKLLMPPFHGERMRNYGEVICNITQSAARKLTVGQTFRTRELVQ